MSGYCMEERNLNLCMSETKVDLSKYHNALSRKHQLVRLLWSVMWGLFARPLPRSMGSGWKYFAEMSASDIRSICFKGTVIFPFITCYFFPFRLIILSVGTT